MEFKIEVRQASRHQLGNRVATSPVKRGLKIVRITRVKEVSWQNREWLLHV